MDSVRADPAYETKTFTSWLPSRGQASISLTHTMNQIIQPQEQTAAKTQNAFIIVACRSCNTKNRIPNPPRLDGVYKCGSCGSLIESQPEVGNAVSKLRIPCEAAKEAGLQCFIFLPAGGFLLFILWPRVLKSLHGDEAVLAILLVSIILFGVLYKLKLSKVKSFLSRIENIRNLLTANQPSLAQRKMRRLSPPLKIFEVVFFQIKAEVERAVEKHLAQQRALEEEQKEQQKILTEELERKKREELSRQVQSKETLDSISPQEFELIVLEAFARLGYKVTHTPWSGDEGIDGLLDKEGKTMAVQCKRHKNNVGQPYLRDFLGAMVHAKCHGGIFVTTSDFSEGARTFAKANRITLLDGKEILHILRETITEDFVLNGRLVKFPKVEPKTCPQCNGRLRKQFGRYGLFWGCSNFPRCRYTEDSGRSIFRLSRGRY
jgi:restriction system protein